MNTLIRETIANAAVILRLRTECTADTVTDELALLVIGTYKDQYNVIPTLWVEYMKESLACKYVLALIEEGYDASELAPLKMFVLRNMYEEHCIEKVISTTVTGTANGGVSIKRAA
jgi:hypothetical protein